MKREREDQPGAWPGVCCVLCYCYPRGLGEMFVDGACCMHCTHAVVGVSAGENENEKGRPLIGLRLHHPGGPHAPRGPCDHSTCRSLSISLAPGLCIY